MRLELISKKFQCKPLFYYFSCGPIALTPIVMLLLRIRFGAQLCCVCICLWCASSAVLSLSANINCVTSSIFVFFVFIVDVVVCSLSFSHFIYIHARLLCRHSRICVFAVRLYWLTYSRYLSRQQKKKREKTRIFFRFSLRIHYSSWNTFCRWTQSR